MSAMKFVPRIIQWPPKNPMATIATENNAIYSLGTQQRSGEKKEKQVNSEI